MIDVVVENLVIESENLMPNILEIQADTFFRFGRRKIYNRKTHRFSVHVSQIQCDLKDVTYYIKKKQGFFRIKDTGVMDLFLGGQGLSFNIKLAIADQKNHNRIFKVENVKAKVKNLNIVLKKSNHKTLFNFFKPLLMSVVKPAISKAAEVQIRRSFDQLDEQIWLVQKEYDKAKEATKDQRPEETVNVINLYIQAIEKRMIQFKDDAKRKSSDIKVCFLSHTPANNEVNVVDTKDTSMFPNIHLPGGISNKATKYREMASEGDEWRSPIFDLGASKATSIPEPKKITRKSPHQHSRTTINDRANAATSSDTGGPQVSRRGFSDSGRGVQDAGLGSAVEQEEFEGTHVKKYNVTGSQLHQDPMSMPYSRAKDTHVVSQDPSRQVY